MISRRPHRRPRPSLAASLPLSLIVTCAGHALAWPGKETVMETKPLIPAHWRTANLRTLRDLSNNYAWEYIALADNHLSDDEYNHRAALLDARAAWLENRIRELVDQI